MPPSAGQSQPDSSKERQSGTHGPRILVTAGPTHEPIDDVRFIGNRSSGRMGIAISDAARKRGCPTTLLLGPVADPPESHSDLHSFQTAGELKDLIEQHWPKHDILIMAAAVSDFTPASKTDGKGPRRTGPFTLELLPTPDLLHDAASCSQPDQTLIGFALQEEVDLEDKGRLKLEQKGVHAIVANPLQTMDSDMIQGLMFIKNGPVRDPGGLMKKADFAAWLIEQALLLHEER